MSDRTVQKVSDPVGQYRYGKSPKNVLEDKRLTSDAKVIYGWLAMQVFQSNTCKKGVRLIASSVGFNKDTVVKAIHALESFGHLKITGVGKTRRTYILLSPVFGQKQGKAEVIVSGPHGKGRRAASLDAERESVGA